MISVHFKIIIFVASVVWNQPVKILFTVPAAAVVPELLCIMATDHDLYIIKGALG